MKVVIGADISGFSLKQEVMAYLEEKGVEFIDVGMVDADQLVPYYEVIKWKD